MGQSAVTLVDGLQGAERAVLDTMVFIYYFEDHAVHADRAEAVFDSAAAGMFEAVVSPVTVAELLFKPLEADRPDIADRYRDALRHLVNGIHASLTFDTGCMAGALRARYGLPLPDMFQVSIALELGSCALITNDRDLAKVKEIPILILDEIDDRGR